MEIHRSFAKFLWLCGFLFCSPQNSKILTKAIPKKLLKTNNWFLLLSSISFPSQGTIFQCGINCAAAHLCDARIVRMSRNTTSLDFLWRWKSVFYDFFIRSLIVVSAESFSLHKHSFEKKNQLESLSNPILFVRKLQHLRYLDIQTVVFCHTTFLVPLANVPISNFLLFIWKINKLFALQWFPSSLEVPKNANRNCSYRFFNSYFS